MSVFNTKNSRVQIKISDVTELLKKSDYHAKLKESERHVSLLLIIMNFMVETLNAKIKQRNLIDESDIYYLVKNTELNTNFKFSNKSRMEGRAS